MMKLTSTLLIIFISFAAFAQTDWSKTGINELINEYSGVFEEGDIAKSLDYVHPVLFKMASKEMMIEKMNESFNNPELQVSMSNFSLDKISNVVNYKSVNYALIDYGFKMKMKHTPKDVREEDTKDNEELSGFMLGMYEAMYGKENVTHDKEDNSYVIKTKNQMFAIGDPQIGSWKLLENKEGMEQMLGDVIPKKVKKKLVK